MSLLRILLLLALAGAGYHYWRTHKAEATLAMHTSPGGFVAIPMPSGVGDRGVVIFAPEHCPSDAAQRAQGLYDALRDRGVPVARASEANFDDLPDQATADRVMQVMNGEIPVVFVNGRGRANPALQDVLAEYRRN